MLQAHARGAKADARPGANRVCVAVLAASWRASSAEQRCMLPIMGSYSKFTSLEGFRLFPNLNHAEQVLCTIRRYFKHMIEQSTHYCDLGPR